MSSLRNLLILTALMCCFLSPAWAAEGGAFLGLDDLREMEEAYESFLFTFEEKLLEKGLLTAEERETWHNAQMGDYFSNGGFGSVLISYYPGMLMLTREEDTQQRLTASLQNGNLSLMTMRRYTPEDSSLPGLMLSFEMEDSAGAPKNAGFHLSSDSGVFYLWDAIQNNYVSMGMNVESNGESVIFSCPTPAENARNPEILIDILDPETGEEIGKAVLVLQVEEKGYRIDEHALMAR